jgi:hypothetical protein
MAAEIYAQTTAATVDPVWVSSLCNGAGDCIPDARWLPNFADAWNGSAAWCAAGSVRTVEFFTAPGGSLIAIRQGLGLGTVTILSTNQLEAEMQIIAQQATGARGSFGFH